MNSLLSLPVDVASRRCSGDRRELVAFRVGTAGIFPVRTNIVDWAGSQRYRCASCSDKLRSCSSGDQLHTETFLARPLSLLEAMRSEVAGRDPSPLERLLAERVVACWLQLQHAEAIHVNGLGELTMSESEYHQRRLDRLHRRYLSAIRTLAQVRKLLRPAVTQINVAEQQVNVAADHLRHDS